MSEQGEKPNRIMVRQQVSNDYVVRIARPITEPDDFDDEFQLLASAGHEDTITLQVITPGGLVDTAHLLCRAIRQTPATVIGYVGPTCASAGTAIILACDAWEVDEMSSFMIHTGSYGAYGKSGEVKAQVEHNHLLIERYIRNTYEGFLTEEEIERMLEGKDFYFEGQELVDRLNAYSAHRDAKLAALQAEYEAALQKELDTQNDQQ